MCLNSIEKPPCKSTGREKHCTELISACKVNHFFVNNTQYLQKGLHAETNSKTHLNHFNGYIYSRMFKKAKLHNKAYARPSPEEDVTNASEW